MLIEKYLPNIVDLVQKNHAISVIAPTGSGKSIGIPLHLSERGVKCFVSVPTVTAATSLTAYQEKLNPGILIGYAAEGDVHYTDKTQLVYVTTGHMRRKMLSYFAGGDLKDITFCDVLMVDEIHLGILDNTIILALWQYAALRGKQVPRLILSTATPAQVELRIPIPEYVVQVESFGVDVRYTKNDYDFEDPSLYVEAGRLAGETHRRTPITEGDMLVFAPGVQEVESVISTLERQKLSNAVIIPVYAALNRENIDRIYEDPAPGTRKIIVGTPLVESAITVKNLGIIIDTLTEKVSETSQTGGLRLVLRRISKDSATQRKGRTGRTRPGVCYRLSTKETYDLLEEHRVPELQRIPIYNVTMEILDVGLRPEDILLGIAPARVDDAIRLLQAVNMVVVNDGKFQAGVMGSFSSTVPLNIRNAAVLWHWLQRAYPPFPGIVAAACIDCWGPGYFWFPRPDKNQGIYEIQTAREKHRETYFAKYAGADDLTTSLNMMRELLENFNGIEPTPSELTRWTQSNSLNNKKVRELLTIIGQCIKAVNRFGSNNPASEKYPVVVGLFTVKNVMDAMRPIISSVYRDMALKFEPTMENIYLHPITGIAYKIDTKNSVNKISELNPEWINALITLELQHGRSIFNVVSFALALEKGTIPEAMAPVSSGGSPSKRSRRERLSRRPVRKIPASPTKGSGPKPRISRFVPSRSVALPPPQTTTTPSEPEEDINAALSLLSSIGIGSPSPAKK